MAQRESRILSLCLLAALAGVSAGCGKSAVSARPGQVVASVNGSEISVHQVNAQLARMNGLTPEALPRVRRELLDRLVDQQLAYDAAIGAKLDRSPEVMMRVEAARREAIANAYLEQFGVNLPTPTYDEIRAYYAEHPALFSERRIYRLQQLSFEASPEIASELKGEIGTGRTLDEAASLLKSRGVNFQGSEATVPAEQLQLDLLPSIAAMRNGETAFFQTPKNALVVRLLSSQRAPIDEESARPAIQQFLQSVRMQELASREISRLKSAAHIELHGEFADAAPPPAIQPVKAPEKPDAGIARGVAGLR